MKKQNTSDKLAQIIRVKEHTSRFTIISNEVIQNDEISARAKGLHAYLISLPDDWKIFKSELVRHFTEGRDALNSAFNELEQSGYIVKNKKRNSDGQFAGYQYRVYESRQTGSDVKENQVTDFQSTGNQFAENPHLQSTHLQRTNKPNTHEFPAIYRKALELAKLIEELHQKEDSRFRGKLQIWAKDIEKLIRLDNREYTEIEQVLRWCKTPDNFWFSNIMSGKKLRQQFPTLLAQMKKALYGAEKTSDIHVNQGPLEFERLLK